MRPIKFEEQTCILAEDQPEYQDLPVHLGQNPEQAMTSCWELSELDKQLLLKTGKIWLTQYTFGKNFQPILLQVRKPELEK